jgi:hypothetical protein
MLNQSLSRYYRRATAIEWKTSITRGAIAVRQSLIRPMKYRSACSSFKFNRKRSSTLAIISTGLLDKSSIPASLIKFSKFKTKPALFRNALNA